jgi:hypothetical protein
MSLEAKYREALGRIKEEGSVAILLKQEDLEGLVVKWRLVLRSTSQGRVMHVLEILDPESATTIQIPLIGDWNKVLNVAEQILNNLDMKTFKEVKKQLVELRPQRGGRSISEL